MLPHPNLCASFLASWLSIYSYACAGTAAILHSFTLAQLTKRMGLTRKNEEAAANLQESGEAAASLQGSKELNLQEN